MDRSMMLFLGGVAVILALFVPMSVLQDSEPVKARTSRAAAKGVGCRPFKTPHAVVGHYECLQKRVRKGGQGETHACVLVCPPSMTTRPKRLRVIHRCHKGRWLVNNEHVHCVAKSSVLLVEQQSAPPALLNTLVSSYLNHSYSYLAMAFVFQRADVQLPGFHKYFMMLSHTAHSMATHTMAYINKRGGWIDLQDLPRPRLAEKILDGVNAGHAGLVAMEAAVDMERESQGLILELMERAERHRVLDPHLLHTLEDVHLSYKVKIIKELMDYVTQLRAFEQTGEGDYELGEYEMDNSLQ